MDQKISSYGWLMVVCGFLILLVTNGMTLTGITVFDHALLSEFGWQRGALKLRDLITFAGAGLIAPIFGTFADHGHIKKCLLLGCAFLAAGFFTYSRINSLTGIYLAHAFFGLSLASAGIVSVVFLVSSHVPVTRRGLALGLALVGSSLGNSVFPQFNLSLINSLGWRAAFLILSVIPVLLALIILFTINKNTMSGILPETSATSDKRQDSLNGIQSIPLMHVLKTPAFWNIGLIAMLTFFAILGVTTHGFLRLTGAGYSQQMAGRALGFLFVMGLFGKLFSGVFADKFGVRPLMVSSLLLMIVGSVGLSHFVESQVLFWVLSFGLGWGALYTLIQVSTVSAFGHAGAGRILGVVAVLEAVGGGLGPWVVGLIYDKTGSYGPGFALIAVGLCLALVLSCRVQAKNVMNSEERFGIELT